MKFLWSEKVLSERFVKRWLEHLWKSATADCRWVNLPWQMVCGTKVTIKSLMEKRFAFHGEQHCATCWCDAVRAACSTAARYGLEENRRAQVEEALFWQRDAHGFGRVLLSGEHRVCTRMQAPPRARARPGGKKETENGGTSHSRDQALCPLPFCTATSIPR